MRLVLASSRSIPVGVSMLIIDAAVRVYKLRPSQVIVGGTQGGMETAGAAWAAERVLPIRKLWPDWSMAEGGIPDRNARMLRMGTHVIAVWDGKSTSTADLVAQARAAGVWVCALHVEPSPATAERIEAEKKAERRAKRVAAASSHGDPEAEARAWLRRQTRRAA